MKNKKIKKKRRAKSFSHSSGQSAQSTMRAHFEARDRGLSADFLKAVAEIRGIVREYDTSDALRSIFVSEIWLPNISSHVKHLLLYAITSETQVREGGRQPIQSYAEFYSFIERLIAAAPRLPTLEDFFPEADWGTVRYEFERKQYRILYGGDIERVFDFVSTFELLHVSLDEQYKLLAQKSPAAELRCALQLQHSLVTAITTQGHIDIQSLPAIGGWYVPSEQFFLQAVQWYESFTGLEAFHASLSQGAVARLEDVNHDIDSLGRFAASVLSGDLLPYVAIEHAGRFHPINARAWVSRLFDRLHRIEDSLVATKGFSPYATREAALTSHLGNMVRPRNFLTGPVCVADPAKGPRDLDFVGALIADNRLILVHLLQSSPSSRDTSAKLRAAAEEVEVAHVLSNAFPNTALYVRNARQLAMFAPPDGFEKSKMRVDVLTILPGLNTVSGSISVPKGYAGMCIPLTSFLGMMDSVQDVAVLLRFLDYWATNGSTLIATTGIDDAFGAFIESHEQIVAGALEPSFLTIDPHWGSNFRYRELSNFWSKFPRDTPPGRAKHWKAEIYGSLGFLEHRSEFRGIYAAELATGAVLVHAEFSGLSYRACNVLNVAIECMADAFRQSALLLEKLRVFKTRAVFVDVFVEHDDVPEEFSPDETSESPHAEHAPFSTIISCLDYGIEVRCSIVLNLKELLLALHKPKDRRTEVDLLMQLLAALDSAVPDTGWPDISRHVEASSGEPPRFYFEQVNQHVAFPEYADAAEPKQLHFKAAMKQLAQLARNAGVEPGTYELAEAKVLINRVRGAFVSFIDAQFRSFDVSSALPFAIGKADALLYAHDSKRKRAKLALKHDVSYDPVQQFRLDNAEFVRLHKAYRYVIEKFVQIDSRGSKLLKADDFSQLVAYADWLLVFYGASDSIHYDLHATGFVIDSEWLSTVLFEKDFEEKEHLYSQEQNRLIKQVVTKSVQLISPFTSDMTCYDAPSLEDLGFRLSLLLDLLGILAAWPRFADSAQVAEVYSASLSELENAIVHAQTPFNPGELEALLNFLVLTAKSVVRLTGVEESTADIPVWEHIKRSSRYAIKPLVLIDGRYFWGANAALQAWSIWHGNLIDATLPANFDTPRLNQVLRLSNEKIEQNLVFKAFEIAKKFTAHAVTELDLFRKYPASGFRDFGDFDLLAFLPEGNVLFYAECKDLTPPFCAKDSRRLRQTIFGREGKDRGHFEKILPRIGFLRTEWRTLFELCGWPSAMEQPPRLVPVYLSRYQDWWMRFPPIDHGVTFLTIERLTDFLADLAPHS
jgi:hypothetical protein